MSDYKYISQYEAHGRVLKRIYNNADHSCYLQKGRLCGAYMTRTKTPDSHHLMTFGIEAVRKKVKGGPFAADRETRRLSLLVLDNYGIGDGEAPLSDEAEDAVFGLRSEEKGYTLAIDRKTGQCYRATFAVYEGDLILFLDDHSGINFKGLPRVPKFFLPHLDILKNKKRPFDLSLPKGLLADFADRRRGTDDFIGNVVVSLHISGARIKITNINIAEDGTKTRTPATGLHGEPAPTDSSQFMELWSDSYRIHTGWEDSGWEDEKDDEPGVEIGDGCKGLPGLRIKGGGK